MPTGLLRSAADRGGSSRFRNGSENSGSSGAAFTCRVVLEPTFVLILEDYRDGVDLYMGAGVPLGAGSWRGVDLTREPCILASCCYGKRRLGHHSGEEQGMTKADVVEQVADALGPRVTKKDCGLAVDAFLAAVKDALVPARASNSGDSAPSWATPRGPYAPQPQDRVTGRGSGPHRADPPTIETLPQSCGLRAPLLHGRSTSGGSRKVLAQPRTLGDSGQSRGLALVDASVPAAARSVVERPAGVGQAGHSSKHPISRRSGIMLARPRAAQADGPTGRSALTTPCSSQISQKQRRKGALRGPRR